MSLLKDDIDELVSRVCTVQDGTHVTNCVQHMNRDLLSRPPDCPLCHADITNKLSVAIRVNQWLNEWKETAEALLKRAIHG